MFKIKINCTHYKNQLNYKNKKINKNTKFDFNNIDIIDKCYILYRNTIDNSFTSKSLEFIINKSLDINELRQFIIMLQNLDFKSNKNTTVQLIDISNNNNHIYYKPIKYNKNDNEELIISPFIHLKKRKSKYNQIELYTK